MQTFVELIWNYPSLFYDYILNNTVRACDEQTTKGNQLVARYRSMSIGTEGPGAGEIRTRPKDFAHARIYEHPSAYFSRNAPALHAAMDTLEIFISPRVSIHCGT